MLATFFWNNLKNKASFVDPVNENVTIIISVRFTSLTWDLTDLRLWSLLCTVIPSIWSPDCFVPLLVFCTSASERQKKTDKLIPTKSILLLTSSFVPKIKSVSYHAHLLKKPFLWSCYGLMSLVFIFKLVLFYMTTIFSFGSDHVLGRRTLKPHISFRRTQKDSECWNWEMSVLFV